MEIKWTVEAEKWLFEIHEYIASDNPVAAGKVINGIFEKAQLLESFPEMGQRYKRVDEGDIRILYYGHYRIAYLLKNTEQIDILGVFHSAMEMGRYLPETDGGMD